MSMFICHLIYESASSPFYIVPSQPYLRFRSDLKAPICSPSPSLSPSLSLPLSLSQSLCLCSATFFFFLLLFLFFYFMFPFYSIFLFLSFFLCHSLLSYLCPSLPLCPVHFIPPSFSLL